MDKFYGKIALWAVVVIFGLVAVSTAFTTIDAGNRGVLMYFGKVSNTILTPGFHFKLPIVNTVKQISVQVQKAQTRETASSSDLQTVTTTVALNFHLDPSKINATYQNIGDLPTVNSKIIEPAVSNAVKAVTAKYKADDLISNRDKVKSEITDQVRAALRQFNIIVDSLNITDFKFSPEYDRAIEDKQVAQQRALKAQYQLQQAQIDSQKQVVEAKAAAEAKIEQAKGDAKATILGAQADTQAMELKNKTITDKILKLNAIQRWDGRVPLFQGSGGQSGLMSMLDVTRIPSVAKAIKENGGSVVSIPAPTTSK